MVETRKVQFTGGSTYIVSLPKSWIVEKEIEVGEPLVLAPQEDGSIVIRPEREYEKKARVKELETEGVSATNLIRTLIGTYMSGYSKIVLRNRNGIRPQARSAIMKFTRMVIGPEIIEESDDKVVLKDLIDPSEFSQRKGLRRMYLIVKKMHEDAVKSFEEQDKPLAEDVIERDEDADRLFWMITKHYNMALSNPRLLESLNISRERSLSYMLVSRAMERIGDHAVRIAENTLNLSDGFDERLVEDIREESDLAMEMLKKSIDSFFKENLNEANRAINKRDKLEEINDRLMKEVKEELKKNVTPLSYILESVSRTGSYATDISEISINYIMSS